jgi:hypothetical protein
MSWMMDAPVPGSRRSNAPAETPAKSCRPGGIALIDVDAASTVSPSKFLGGSELNKTKQHYSCWERLQWELRPSFPLFSIDEPSGAKIDVAASFGARRTHNGSCSTMFSIITVRLVFFVWSVQVLYEDVSHYPPHNLYIYMGYLTHWGHVLTILYFTSSFLCAILILPPVSTGQPASSPLSPDEYSQSVSPQPQPPSQPQPQPHILVRVTWGLYSTVAPLEVAITLLYWASGGVNDNGPVTYISVMEHGGLAVLVWLDGLVLVSVVPVRAKHIWFLLTVCVLYLTWSVIDVVAGIGGGEWGPADTDDALYPVLRWGSETRAAALLSAFTICVLAPGLFMACWLLSLASLAASNNSSREEEEEGVTSHQQCVGCCCCGGGGGGGGGCVFHGLRRKVYREESVTLDGAAAFDYNGMEKAVMTDGSPCLV